VEKLFKVKVADVRTMNIEGKLRRRAVSPDTVGLEKGVCDLKPGQKSPEYADL